MKTILIPTDFSASADNAARYAVALAKGIQANIKLCHAVMVPVEAPFAAGASVPILALDALEQEAKDKIKALSAELSQQHPAVSYQTELGSIREMVRKIEKQGNICMAVMGMSGAGGLEKFLMGSSSREMVDATILPLLLVPSKARFQTPQRIAFATDLNQQDIGVLHVLAGMARHFNAAISIIHVGEKAIDEQMDSQAKVTSFLNDISNKVNYHNIYYQYVKRDTIDEGLEWITKSGQVDILAMVHHKHTLFQDLLQGSHTHRLRKKTEIPLLVFPPDCCSRVL